MTKVYPQRITGKYRTIKNYANGVLLLFYFLVPWFRWNRDVAALDQAIIIDLHTRRAYFFDIEIWPEEVFYITVILIIAAFCLFLFTSIFGRIWCGYTCPHTVFVDLFIKIETFFQGDRNARIAADQAPMNSSVLSKKILTHASWFILSFAFAFGWVCYFYNAPHFFKDLLSGHLGIASKSWLFGLTLATYGFAGFMREKMCTYICPYGRFQSAMLDNESLIVTYHDWRGEPRKKNCLNTKSLGDCINCYKCVAVCPMGIDIRNGMQMQCISCGLCIDACDSVMSKINKPLGLIAYDSVNSTAKLRNGIKTSIKLLRPKLMIYGFMIVMFSIFILKNLLNKSMFILSVERERGPLLTITPDGGVRNTYNIYLANKSLKKKDICLELSGIKGIMLKSNIEKIGKSYQKKLCFTLAPDSENQFKVFAKVNSSDIGQGEKKLTFIINDLVTQKLESADSVFLFDRAN